MLLNVILDFLSLMYLFTYFCNWFFAQIW